MHASAERNTMRGFIKVSIITSLVKNQTSFGYLRISEISEINDPDVESWKSTDLGSGGSNEEVFCRITMSNGSVYRVTNTVDEVIRMIEEDW
jgi:hypothetical protein